MDKRIEPGMPVVSSDGIALGTVANVDPDGFAIAGGHVVHGEHRAGMLDVAGVFAGEVYLRKRAAEFAMMPAERDAPPPSM